MEQLARFSDETRSLPPPRQSSEFARTVALERIGLSNAWGRVQMIEITSSNMALLFKVPDTVFDEVRMNQLPTGLDLIVLLNLGGGIALHGRRKWGLRKAYGDDQATLGTQRFC